MRDTNLATPKPWSWSEQVALVTGGGRGIGAATARLLAERGARVIVSSRTRAEIDEVARTIHAQAPGRAAAIEADVADEASVRALFAEARARFGAVTILVNNAGYFEGGEVRGLSVESWERVMAVNLRGPFVCAREALGQMVEAGRGGAIVNVSSIGGLRGSEKFKGFAAYTVSKFGVVGLTECLAVEGREHGVRVNCVAPGAVETRMLREAAPFLKTETRPEDVARSIAYLCDGNEARAVTGAVLEIFSNVG